MSENIEIKLIMSSDKIIYSDIENFIIGLKITNNNDKAEKFDISKTKLFVNNAESIAWSLCTQNGTIINLTIPSKKTETIQWPLGTALFQTIGEYHLKLLWNSIVQEAKVTVMK